MKPRLELGRDAEIDENEGQNEGDEEAAKGLGHFLRFAQQAGL